MHQIHIHTCNKYLWPWVAHLRITVSKSDGSIIASNIPALNFDAPAVSVRP